MGRHGSEQSGVYQSFTISLKANNNIRWRNPLAPFMGNRFNILFFDAGVVFFLSLLMKKLLIEVWQTPNKLLRAVLADVQVQEFIAGCKALGLIYKIITGPLWRVIESKDYFVNSWHELSLSVSCWLCRTMVSRCFFSSFMWSCSLWWLSPFWWSIMQITRALAVVNLILQCRRSSKLYFVLFQSYFIDSWRIICLVVI